MLLTKAKSIDEWIEKHSFDNEGRSYAHDVHWWLDSHDLHTYIVIAGVDTEGHVFKIQGKNDFQVCDAVGVAVECSGWSAADYVLSQYDHTTRASLDRTKITVYEAVRAAMSEGGVPDGTVDMTVIDSNGIHKVPGSEVEALRTIYMGRSNLRGSVAQLRRLRKVGAK